MDRGTDDSDLPKLQFIQLGEYALEGGNMLAFDKVSSNWRNTLTMRSGIEWDDESTDLPLLRRFMGTSFILKNVDSVILESTDSRVD